MARNLVVLGSTGSIGQQALEVIRAHGDKFRVIGLSAHSNIEELLGQVEQFRPRVVGITSGEAAETCYPRLKNMDVEIMVGEECLQELASFEEVELVINAVVGSVGLAATLVALEKGKTLALANKESMVAGGPLVVRALEKGGTLLPVDSEHSAIFQCLRGERREDVERIILTASGGPFRGWRREDLRRVTVEQALAHPTWKMGKKITIDSATLMNKGLEVIEAHYLFGVPYERIEVVFHPQSIIHSMVEFRDGAIIAQLGLPDMRLPISFALSYPERWGPGWVRTSIPSLGSLTFEEADMETFKCLRLAYEAGEMGGTATTVLNVADEVAVDAFLKGKIRFLEIGDIVECVLHEHSSEPVLSLEQIRKVEAESRAQALRLVDEMGGL